MSVKMKIYLAIVVSMAILVGCGKNEEVTEFNKSASYWYEHIAESIASNNLEKADEYYISLKSEHMLSPLMPTAILMLAQAHMQEEEYLLAGYYLDEFAKRYADESNYDYVAYMKLKAAFLGIKDAYKDQKLILDTIADAQKYLYRYPGSRYVPLVNAMLIRLHMTQYLLNENIAALYERIDKPEAAKIYREKNAKSIVNMDDITPPEKGIAGKIFD